MRVLRSIDRSVLADIAVAVVVTISAFGITAQIAPEPGERAIDALGVATILLAGSALALRTRSPITAVGLVGGALGVYLGRGYLGGPVFVALFVALYSVAVQRPRRLALAAGTLVSAFLFVVGAVAGTGPGLLLHLVFFGWAGAALFLGDAVRSRREHLAALHERTHYLEETREEEARRRVAEERLRIAQDLHDSVAHSMAAINVQSGVAAHVFDRHPDKARAALDAVRNTSEEVLEEMAAFVALLRVDRNEPAPRTPAPRLEQIPDLIESSQRAGAEVTLRVEGALRTVPVPLAVAAYRIVQESLTNVIRHARPAEATVTVRYGDDGAFMVEIVDLGTSRLDGYKGSGVGVVGMRERAQATGGTFEAGPSSQGGFRVRARWEPR